MQGQPSPEAQKAINAAREQAWRRIMAHLPRALAHQLKDACMAAWDAGYEYRKRGE